MTIIRHHVIHKLIKLMKLIKTVHHILSVLQKLMGKTIDDSEDLEFGYTNAYQVRIQPILF